MLTDKNIKNPGMRYFMTAQFLFLMILILMLPLIAGCCPTIQ